MEAPIEWSTTSEEKDVVYLLDYPFLFPPSVLVSYFRAYCYDSMYVATEKAVIAQHLTARVTFANSYTTRGSIPLQDRLKKAQTAYLTLDIRREHVLTDAMDQLWRREGRELTRPLKIRMGMEEGEEGVDHGGVQQEFFRVAIAEALDPKYGMLTHIVNHE